MSDNDINEYSTDPPPVKKRAWSLKTPEKARKALAKLIREIYKNESEYDIQRYRALIYGLSQLLSYFAFEKDLEIEKRIEALERKVLNK